VLKTRISLSALRNPAIFWAALSGLLLTGAFPDIGLWPLAAIGLVPLLLSLAHVRWKTGFLFGWVAGMVHHLTLLYWTAYTMHVYGYLPWALTVPVLILFSAYLSLYTGVFGVLAAGLGRHPTRLLVGAPVAWVALEYVRGHAFTGFPWAQLGTSLHPWTHIIQVVDITGVYGLSGLLVLVNCALTILWRHVSKNDATAATTRRQAAAAVTAAAVAVAAVAGYGAWRIGDIDSRVENAPTVRVSVIQGNIDQAVKWDQAFLDATLNTYVDLSLAAAERRPDLVVWPETATPYYYGRQKDMDAVVNAGIGKAGAHFLIGIPTYARKNGKYDYFNTAALIDPSGRLIGRYSKSHLVPFGEYVPLKRWLPFIGKMVAQVGDFTAGDPGVVLSWPGGAIGAQICYEVIFPALSREMVRNGADLLVNITNDAWFGRTGAPHQHAAMAAFRAVENRRAMARAANTGISGFVTPSGRLFDATGLFQTAQATADLPRLTLTTVYTRVGDVFAVGCLIGTMLMAIHSAMRRWKKDG
jgi:apolipoprotein N-acyltransferase